MINSDNIRSLIFMLLCLRNEMIVGVCVIHFCLFLFKTKTLILINTLIKMPLFCKFFFLIFLHYIANHGNLMLYQ